MNRLLKPLITVYRIGNEIFFSKDDAILYCKTNRGYKDLETITLSRVAPELPDRYTGNSRTTITIEKTLQEKQIYYCSYSGNEPEYSLDLTVYRQIGDSFIIEECSDGEFESWEKLIKSLFEKGYHVKNGISPFQLYESDGRYFSSKKALDEYISKNNSIFHGYRIINLYPNACGNGKDIVVVEDTFDAAIAWVDCLHFIRQVGELGQNQYFDYQYPISAPNDRYDIKLLSTEIAWENCVEFSGKYAKQKTHGGTYLACNQAVAESTFNAIKNHHTLLGVTPITGNSGHLFLYDGQFYTNYGDVFNRCKKDNKNLNETVRVYEYFNVFPGQSAIKTSAIKTYMFGDNVAECFAYCDENAYSRLGLDENGEIVVSEILDNSLDEVQTVFYYFMKQGLTPPPTTACIKKYFSESSREDKLRPLSRVLAPKNSV